MATGVTDLAAGMIVLPMGMSEGVLVARSGIQAA